jgi:hypothetical protein
MFSGLLADGYFLGDLISLMVSGFGLFITIVMHCDGSPESFFQRCGASPLRKGDVHFVHLNFLFTLGTLMEGLQPKPEGTI